MEEERRHCYVRFKSGERPANQEIEYNKYGVFFVGNYVDWGGNKWYVGVLAKNPHVANVYPMRWGSGKTFRINLPEDIKLEDIFGYILKTFK